MFHYRHLLLAISANFNEDDPSKWNYGYCWRGGYSHARFGVARLE